MTLLSRRINLSMANYLITFNLPHFIFYEIQLNFHFRDFDVRLFYILDEQPTGKFYYFVHEAIPVGGDLQTKINTVPEFVDNVVIPNLDLIEESQRLIRRIPIFQRKQHVREL